MKKLLSMVLVGCLMVEAFGQIDVTETIFSKMDIAPQHELWDGSTTMLMGFTSLLGDDIDIPGPTLIYTEGDSVELKLWNMSQGAPHTIHLHGLDVNQQNDGVPHLSFQVEHSETRSYFFKAPHPGTYIYHCHVVSTLHVQAGMYGLLIVKPAGNQNLTWSGGYEFDSEHAWMTSELDTNWHTDQLINHSYDSVSGQTPLPDFDPQYFLINGRSENQLAAEGIAIQASVNEKVLLRLANIGFYGNRFEFPPALNATIISSDGRPLPAVEESDTMVILPGERYQVLLEPSEEFIGEIAADFFNLNTQQTISTQEVGVSVSGFFNVEELYSRRIGVYPNPVTDVLYINDFAGERIEVFDLKGNRLLSQPFSPTINVSCLVPGTYMVISDNKSTQFIKR